MHTKYPQLVQDFITASKAVFNIADIVVIEIQMVAKFKIIQTAFQCFFLGQITFDRTTVRLMSFWHFDGQLREK